MTTDPDRRLFIAGLAAATTAPAAAGAVAQPERGPGAPPAQPGYLLVTGRSFDPAQVRRYGAALPAIYAAHDGSYLGIGAQGRGVDWIEGPMRDRSLVLAVFPSLAGAQDFWWSPAYRAAITLRDRAGVFTVAALEGTGPVPAQGVGSAYLVTFLAANDTHRTGTPAAEAHRAGVIATGGAMMATMDAGAAVPLEGDSVFNRIWLAGWPTAEGRAAFLASREAQTARRLREAAGFTAVATLDGTARP